MLESDIFRSSEQKQFFATVMHHMAAPDGPLLLEGGTGLGKTRAYLAAVMQSGKRVAIVLPTHALIDQVLASSDLAATRSGVDVMAFRPALTFDSRKEYEAQREAARAAQVMICTAASVIIDQRLSGEYNGATTERDYILFDEADQLPDMAALQSDFKITAHDLSELNIPLTTAAETVAAIINKPSRVVEPEIRAAAKVIAEALAEPVWYQSAGLDDEGGVVLTHKLPGRLLKKISNRPNVAFVSATISIGGKFNDFRNVMGITSESQFSSRIEPERHGDLTVTVQDINHESPEWLPAVVEAIKTAVRPCLVVTPSHALSEQLGALIPDAIAREIGEKTAELAKLVGDSGILIAAGAWAGLDTPVAWASVIVPRVPFGAPVVVEGEITTSYLDARNTAVRRLRQAAGRGLRSPDAKCAVVIVDARAAKLPRWVPERFAAPTFIEGGRHEVTYSKAERDPATRRAALKHYGFKCMRCGLVPRVESQLDVHHLNPIAEGGERRTTLADLAVICANCHRLVHSVSPPMPVAYFAQRDR